VPSQLQHNRHHANGQHLLHRCGPHRCWACRRMLCMPTALRSALAYTPVLHGLKSCAKVPQVGEPAQLCSSRQLSAGIPRHQLVLKALCAPLPVTLVGNCLIIGFCACCAGFPAPAPPQCATLDSAASHAPSALKGSSHLGATTQSVRLALSTPPMLLWVQHPTHPAQVRNRGLSRVQPGGAAAA
jgi:hypothetical protein